MRDIEEIAARLRRQGHYVERIDYSLGGLPEDFDVDVDPHTEEVHLKLQICEYVVTSIALIFQKRSKRKFFSLL
jgi:hypothetical protein